MKLLFLDIDGVLNTDDELRKYGRSYICPKKASYIPNIIRQTGCRIVLSSSWRLGGTYKSMKKALNDVDFKLLINSMIGATPMKFSNVNRGNEICWWFIDALENDEGLNIESCVIFDDISGWFRDYERYLIQTDENVGLTNELVQQAISQLNTTADHDILKPIRDLMDSDF